VEVADCYSCLDLPLLLSIWLILAGARLVRGEEERSTLDVLLATPRSRARLLLEKVGALLIASLLIAVLVALGAVAGEAVLGGQHVNLARALLVGLNLSLFAFFFGMVALLVSQFIISRGAAAGVTAGLLLLALLLYITGQEVNGSWLQFLSPFYILQSQSAVHSWFLQPTAGSAGHRDRVPHTVLPGGDARRACLNSLLDWKALDLLPLWESDLPGYELGQLPGDDWRRHRAGADWPRPVPLSRC
jgi:hypothetical protein